METFRQARPFVSHPDYKKARNEALSGLQDEINKGSIYPPVLVLLKEFSTVPHCFTIQCCYGHFVHEKEPDDHNLAQLAPYAGIVRDVQYRIAYLALCIENSYPGRELFQDLMQITIIDPDYIQFGSADWFWERNKNSYTIQVEPVRFMTQDRAALDIMEALYVENIRNRFFNMLAQVVRKHQNYFRPLSDE